MSTAAIGSNVQNTPRVANLKPQAAAAPAKSPSAPPPAHGHRQAQRLQTKEPAAQAGGVSRSNQPVSTKGERLNVKA